MRCKGVSVRSSLGCSMQPLIAIKPKNKKMSTTLTKERVKAVSIEYLPTEDEMDFSKPLMVGKGLTDKFVRTEDLGYKLFFGTKRYICGLDPEVVRYDSTL